MPNVGDLLDVLAESAPDPATRDAILVDQPRAALWLSRRGDGRVMTAPAQSRVRCAINARMHEQGSALPRSRPPVANSASSRFCGRERFDVVDHGVQCGFQRFGVAQRLGEEKAALQGGQQCCRQAVDIGAG